MRTPIQSLIFFQERAFPAFRLFVVRLKPGNLPQTLDHLQKRWAGLLPGAAFEFTFLDDSLAQLYRSETQLKKATYAASILAFLIVSLGVLGIVSLSVQKRRKEIGVRKVLGANVSNIFSLFLREIMSVGFFAALIACPCAYLLMNRWLSVYAYRINLTPATFILAVSVLLLFCALLIIAQTWRTVVTNPVKSLRIE